MVITPAGPQNWVPTVGAGRLPLAPVESLLGLGLNSSFQAPSQWSGHLDLGTVWADPQTTSSPMGRSPAGSRASPVLGSRRLGWGPRLPAGEAGLLSSSPEVGCRPTPLWVPAPPVLASLALGDVKAGSRDGLGHGKVAVCPTGGAKGWPFPSFQDPQGCLRSSPSWTFGASAGPAGRGAGGSRGPGLAPGPLASFSGTLCPSRFGREPSPPLLELASATA